MEKKAEPTKKIIINPASSINFKSEEIKKSFEKVKEKKKELAGLSRIDRNKLNICISV
jgi:hypothetical protein